MLIPSIDLMGGKIVQLVQGEKKALEFANFSEWVERFSNYPLVQLIDLDLAMGRGSNRRADCRVLWQADMPSWWRNSVGTGRTRGTGAGGETRDYRLLFDFERRG